MVHAHATGALSIVSYEELKNIIHSFFYMSSIFNTVNQPNFQLELEKKDKFEASDKYNVMTQELKRLKEIDDELVSEDIMKNMAHFKEISKAIE